MELVEDFDGFRTMTLMVSKITAYNDPERLVLRKSLDNFRGIVPQETIRSAVLPHLIAHFADIKATKLFLEYGIDPTVALYRALLCKWDLVRLDMAQLAIDAGANLNGHLPMLIKVAAHLRKVPHKPIGSAQISLKLRFLLGAGADINLPGPDGVTTVMIAEQAKYPEIVEMLVQRGATFDARDALTVNQKYLFEVQEVPANLEVVRGLLEAGADVHYAVPGAAYATHRFQKACDEAELGLVELFLEYGQVPEKAFFDTVKNFAFNDVDFQEHLRVLETLIAAGADLKISRSVREICMYPLEHAATVFKMMLDTGADVDSPDASGDTLLMKVIRSSSHAETLAKILLERGADVNARNVSGTTPLMEACKCGHTVDTLVQMLCDAGADANAKNEEGQTCLDILNNNPRNSALWAKREELIRDIVVLEHKKNACRIIKRALWKLVQRRRQLETLHELYRPGGIGTERGKKIFEDIFEEIKEI
jgi:ankyrin repeat protein